MKPFTIAIYPVLSYKHLLLMSFLLGLVQLSPAQLSSNISSQKAMQRLLHDLEDQKVLNWKLSYNLDAYEEGTLLRTEESHTLYLQLTATGRYEEWEDGQQTSGKWHLNRQGQVISFFCQQANGIRLPGKPLPCKFQIKEYDNNRLVMIWPGRHGMVKRVFVPVKDIEAASKSQSVVMFK